MLGLRLSVGGGAGVGGGGVLASGVGAAGVGVVSEGVVVTGDGLVTLDADAVGAGVGTPVCDCSVSAGVVTFLVAFTGLTSLMSIAGASGAVYSDDVATARG